MRTALLTHGACLRHVTPKGHPECANRLRAVLEALQATEFDSLLRFQAPRASRQHLIRAHTSEYVESILTLRPEAGKTVQLDPDTVMSRGSAEAALRAAGAVVAAVDLVMNGTAEAAFAAVRPPGHHAEAARAMGYCIFNNAAVAVQHARAHWKLQRVAVADFDAHHGNGTQAMFANEADVFYGSSHQFPCFPGTGGTMERQNGGNIVTVPLIPNSTGADLRNGWREVILPALDEFGPELLVVSAGFDAHYADPTAHLQAEPEDFAWLTSELMRIASEHADGRIVAVLEGGYALKAVAASAAAHVRTLLSMER